MDKQLFADEYNFIDDNLEQCLREEQTKSIRKFYDCELSKIYYSILDNDAPERSDYISEEDYINACMKFQKDLIEKVKTQREQLYFGAVSDYNTLLDEFNNFSIDNDIVKMIKDNVNESYVNYIKSTYNARIAFDIGAATTLGIIFPDHVAFICGFFGTRAVINIIKKVELMVIT